MLTSKNSFTRLITRLSVLCMLALVTGILVNQIMDQGIRWRVLMLSLPWNGDSPQMIDVDAAFAAHLAGETRFIDIRESQLFDMDHTPNAISLPFMDAFEQEIIITHETGRIIVYDLERFSNQAELVARRLNKSYPDRVFVMRGGYLEWLDKGYPTEQ